MKGVAEHIKTVSSRLETLRAARSRHPPDRVTAAGRLAEMEAGRQISAALRGTGWTLHSAVRVTDPKTPEFLRSEVDFIVTSLDSVVMLEVKNWSGHIQLQDGHLIQGPRRDREAKDHGPVFDRMLAKEEVLKRFHRFRGRGAPPPIQSLLVFWHPRVTLSTELADRPDVMFGNALQQHLPDRRGTSGGLVDALLALLRHLGLPVKAPAKCPEPSRAVGELRESIQECGSWDTLSMNGGLELAGDFIRAHGALSGLVDRRSVASATVAADRNPLVALIRDPRVPIRLLMRDGKKKTCEAGKDAAISFQPAGSEKPITYPVAQCNEMTFGYVERRPGHRSRT
jgi:hypothetical protein